MECPKCGSEAVIVQVMETKSKTKKKGIGLGGHINNTARGLTAVATLGVSNLVWKKIQRHGLHEEQERRRGRLPEVRPHVGALGLASAIMPATEPRVSTSARTAVQIPRPFLF